MRKQRGSGFSSEVAEVTGPGSRVPGLNPGTAARRLPLAQNLRTSIGLWCYRCGTVALEEFKRCPHYSSVTSSFSSLSVISPLSSPPLL